MPTRSGRVFHSIEQDLRDTTIGQLNLPNIPQLANLSKPTNMNENYRKDSSEEESIMEEGRKIPIFQPIRPPTLLDTTRDACYKFEMEYRRYKLNVERRNASSSTEIQLISMRDCIDETVFQCLWRYGMRLRTEEEATEELIEKWIRDKSRITDTSNLLHIERNMKKYVKMDFKIHNLEDRLEKLFGQFTKYLSDQGVIELYLEESQKQSIKLFITLLEPKTFKEQVFKDLQIKNKEIRKDWYKFVTYLLNKARDMDKVLACFDLERKEEVKTEQISSKKIQETKEFKKKRYNDFNFTKHKSKEEKPRRHNAPKCLNKNCQEYHLLRDCSNTTTERKKEIYEEWKKKKEEEKRQNLSVGNIKKVSSRTIESGCIKIILEDKVELPVALDNGADVTVMSERHLKLLEDAEAFINIKHFKEVLTFNTASEFPVHSTKECSINLELRTPAGNIKINHAQVFVIREDIPEILFGKPLLNLLGIDISALLGSIAEKNAGKQYEGRQAVMTFNKANHLYKLTLNGETEVQITEDSPVLQSSPLSKDDLFFQEPTGYTDVEFGQASEKEIEEALLKLSQNTPLGKIDQEKLFKLLLDYRDVFRLKLGNDPPALVEPRKVIMQQGATPKKCTARKYPELHQKFMEEECKILEENSMIYENDKSLWCSNALVVPKGKGFRLVNDARYTNANIMHTQWPMPILEVCLTHLSKKKYFSTIDLFKGYWQFPLHEDSQEYFSFMTHNKVYTPTRLVQGDTGAVEYFQRQMMKVFQPLLNKQLLIWLDDLLLYSSTIEEMYQGITSLFKLCLQYNLKLNANKCRFFQDSIKWCGRIIDQEGIKQDPERIQALSNITTPVTAQQLQQFICASNWMRTSLPKFTEVTAPLREILELAYKKVGKRTSSSVKRVELKSLGWSKEHDLAFQEVINLLKSSITLAHPNPDYAFCVFTDASQGYWAAVITQVPPEDLKLPFEQQQHAPLAFLSGAFKGAASRWAIVEKEAFPIVEVCSKYAWLLLQPHGFHLFTDHRNLIYIFDPLGSRPTLPKHIADRLSRWALHLLGFRYTIHHITGEDNVWSDLLSRWGASQKPTPSLNLIYALPEGLSPLQHEDFIWPSLKEILRIQQRYHISPYLEEEDPNVIKKLEWNNTLKIWKYKNLVWIPHKAKELKIRIMVIAHAGTAGHKGIEITKMTLKKEFYWKTLNEDIEKFIQECLHCLTTTGGQKIPRPYGEQLHSITPGELIHFDFLFIRPKSSETKYQYILIIKDDASGFCELTPSESPTTETTITALMEWFKRYGIAKMWISDQGTHFKNQLMCELRHLLGGDHHFVTAGVPWANGTIERVNREVLRTIRALISEFKLPHTKWIDLLPLIQLIINATPSKRLGNRSPMEVFLGRKPEHLLRSIYPAKIKTIQDIKIVQEERIKNIEELLTSIEKMHQEVATTQQQSREQNRMVQKKKKNVQKTNFQIGDYVLQACGEEYTGAKLLVRWLGPYRITQCKNEWIFIIEDLNTGSTKEVHSSRLKFYQDKNLKLTEEIKLQAAQNQQGYEVKSFRDHRKNLGTKEWELLTEWRGFSIQEATWETLKGLYDDLPEKVKKYVDKLPHSKSKTDLKKELDLLFSEREV